MSPFPQLQTPNVKQKKRPISPIGERSWLPSMLCVLFRLPWRNRFEVPRPKKGPVAREKLNWAAWKFPPSSRLKVFSFHVRSEKAFHRQNLRMIGKGDFLPKSYFCQNRMQASSRMQLGVHHDLPGQPRNDAGAEMSRPMGICKSPSCL